MTTTPSRPGKTPATVAFVGAGPGDPGLLTVRAVELLAEADAVVIDQIARDQVVARHCRPEVDVVDAGRGDHGQRLTHAANAKLVVSTARAHKGGLVVRLMDGDPATFNGLAEEALACAKAGVPVEVVPGVSAVSAVPAYAGVPLTTAESSAVHVIAHAGGTKGRASTVDPACLDPRSTVVVLGSAEALAAGLAALLEAGRDAGTPVAVTGHGTSVRQSTAVTTLEDATAAVESAPTPALAVVGPTVDLRQTINWFESRPLFGWNVLVPRTKEQSESIDRRLSRYGAISTVVPTISVEPRAPRSRWSARSRAWSPVATSGSGSPPSTPSRPCGSASKLSAWTCGPSPASRSQRWVASPPRRCVTGGSSPTSCRRGSSPHAACSRSGRPTTTCSTRSTELVAAG